MKKYSRMVLEEICFLCTLQENKFFFITYAGFSVLLSIFIVIDKK